MTAGAWAGWAAGDPSPRVAENQTPLGPCEARVCRDEQGRRRTSEEVSIIRGKDFAAYRRRIELLLSIREPESCCSFLSPDLFALLMTANGKKTVLLVEDNEDNRIVYSTILRHFGYAVTEALNGEEGIAKARAERPDLILMDISIPVIDGWEATQVLKHDPKTREIPIIALTAHALASDREKAMEVGCDGYLAKPCEPRAVVAEVQRFLGKNDGSPP